MNERTSNEIRPLISSSKEKGTRTWRAKILREGATWLIVAKRWRGKMKEGHWGVHKRR